jgi:F-type H+-transporting ATPase subunit gamma
MNIREVGKKIKSVSNVKKITHALQLVSAVKMKKAQEAASDAAAYQQFLERSIQRVGASIDPQFSPILKVKTNQATKKLLIVVSSNKGLCGAFNLNLFRFFQQQSGKDVHDVVVVGKKGGILSVQLGHTVAADFSSHTPLTNVGALFDFVLEAYMSGRYGSVNVIYNKFISSFQVEPTIDQLLPFQMSHGQSDDPSFTHGEYAIEPDPEVIIDALIKSYIEEKIRYAIMQSEAGEHSARMMAMKNATDNAKEVVSSLTSLKNKLRQQKITYELLDMITAKESVEQSS